MMTTTVTTTKQEDDHDHKPRTLGVVGTFLL
jgi:hypothetical protein